MTRTSKLVLALAAAAALGGTLAGCVVAPAQPYYGGYAEYDSGPVMVAPPAPQVEYYGPPPIVGQVWINGFWGWSGGRHVWHGGYWGTPPHAGAHWVPHTWEHQGNGWRLRRGHWG